MEVSEVLHHRVAGGLWLARHVERRKGVEQVAVQAELRGEAIRRLKGFVSRLAHGGLRMDVEEELRLRQEFLEATGQFVKRNQGVLNRPSVRDLDDLANEGAARREVLLEQAGELRGRLREQQL